MQMATRRFLCGAGLIVGAAAILACLSLVMAQESGTAGLPAGADKSDSQIQADSNVSRAARQEAVRVNPAFVADIGKNEDQQKISHSYDQKTRDLLSKYNATNDQAERDQLVKEVTQIAAEEFDARQESRSQELKNLEEQLKKLRALHDRRAKEKDEIVRDRVRHLLRDADGLGWGTDRIVTPSLPGQGMPQGNERNGPNSTNIRRGN